MLGFWFDMLYQGVSTNWGLVMAVLTPRGKRIDRVTTTKIIIVIVNNRKLPYRVFQLAWTTPQKLNWKEICNWISTRCLDTTTRAKLSVVSTDNREGLHLHTLSLADLPDRHVEIVPQSPVKVEQ